MQDVARGNAQREALIDALTMTARDGGEDLPFPGILTWDGVELAHY